MAEYFEFRIDEEQRMPTKEEIRRAEAALIRWAWSDDVEVVVHCRDCERQQMCRLAQRLGENGYCSEGERRNDA